MPLATIAQIEQQQFFAIQNDLRAAVRDNIPSVTEFHLNELVAMEMHTESDRLRRACRRVIAEHRPVASAKQA